MIDMRGRGWYGRKKEVMSRSQKGKRPQSSKALICARIRQVFMGGRSRQTGKRGANFVRSEKWGTCAGLKNDAGVT